MTKRCAGRTRLSLKEWRKGTSLSDLSSQWHKVGLFADGLAQIEILGHRWTAELELEQQHDTGKVAELRSLSCKCGVTLETDGYSIVFADENGYEFVTGLIVNRGRTERKLAAIAFEELYRLPADESKRLERDLTVWVSNAWAELERLNGGELQSGTTLTALPSFERMPLTELPSWASEFDSTWFTIKESNGDYYLDTLGHFSRLEPYEMDDGGIFHCEISWWESRNVTAVVTVIFNLQDDNTLKAGSVKTEFYLTNGVTELSMSTETFLANLYGCPDYDTLLLAAKVERDLVETAEQIAELISKELL